jgi:hypothetical protein
MIFCGHEDRTEGLFRAVDFGLTSIKFFCSAIKPLISPQYLTELLYTGDNYLHPGMFQKIHYLVILPQTCQIFSDSILG